MRMDLLVTGVLSGIAGAATHYAFATHLWPNRHMTYSWWFAMRKHRNFGYVCDFDLLLEREGYSLGYGYDRKCALWVSYIISKRSIGVDVDRGDRFYADPEVPEAHRVQPYDFRNTGYHKGHLAPSAAIDFSRKSNDQTFAMSNISLQHPSLNRGAWSDLERSIRRWTRTKGKLAVIAGPLFGKRSQRVNGMPVPRFFFKVVYSFREKRSIGFVIPNKEIGDAEFWEYAVSVAQIEQENPGYIFFKRLGDSIQSTKKQCDVEWWKREQTGP